MSNKIKFQNWQKNLFLIMASSLFALCLAEITLRITKPHDQFASLLPNLEKDQSNQHHKFFPGIDSVFHFSVNKSGYRSSSRFDLDRYGILTIGGSSTYCLGLGDSDSWPWLLENRLNLSDDKQNITVGNIGVPAFNSGNHLLQLKYIEPQLENIKMVIMLMGINDFQRYLISNQEYLPTRKDKNLFRKTFLQFPRKTGQTWYQRTELWMHIRDMANHYKMNRSLNGLFSLDELVSNYEKADKTDLLPNLQPALNDYESNIHEIISIARDKNIKLVLVTQPVFWNQNMTNYEERLVSYASPATNGVALSPKALNKGMKRFNDKLREISKAEKVDLIDLSKRLPKDTTIFFDHCHYNKSGAIKVAEVIYEELQTILNKRIAQGENNLGIKLLPKDGVNDKP